MKRFFMILPSALVLAIFLGCGSKLPPGMPKLYSLTLIVTYDDGKPVDDASVRFLVTDPVLPQTWLHAGTTDSEGKVKLMTDGTYSGIPAGKYSVTIEKYAVERPSRVPGSGAGEPPSLGPPPQFQGDVIPCYLLVDDVYLDHAKTPLKDIEVKSRTREMTLTVGKEQRIYKPIIRGAGM